MECKLQGGSLFFRASPIKLRKVEKGEFRRQREEAKGKNYKQAMESRYLSQGGLPEWRSRSFGRHVGSHS